MFVFFKANFSRFHSKVPVAVGQKTWDTWEKCPKNLKKLILDFFRWIL